MKNKKRGSGSSIEELVELHDERCEQNHATTKNDEDIEKVMEHEGSSSGGNMNVMTIVKTESE